MPLGGADMHSLSYTAGVLRRLFVHRSDIGDIHRAAQIAVISPRRWTTDAYVATSVDTETHETVSRRLGLIVNCRHTKTGEMHNSTVRITSLHQYEI